jgi:hypothetical protein
VTLCPCGRSAGHRGPCKGVAIHRAAIDRRPDSPAATAAALAIDESEAEMRDLDLAIEMGWGDIPRDRLPADWRTRKNPKARRTW